MADEILLTQEGYDKLEAEHDDLISVRRKEVSEKLKEARSYGDLSENAEYDAAKEEQAEVEERILKLEQMMRNARIVTEDDVEGDTVNVGLTVTVKETKKKTTAQFILVGANETDPFAEPSIISTDSEIGKNLLCRKVGDRVETIVPDGVLHYEVTKISR